jgi:uncharacterized membrane protein YeiH
VVSTCEGACGPPGPLGEYTRERRHGYNGFGSEARAARLAYAETKSAPAEKDQPMSSLLVAAASISATASALASSAPVTEAVGLASLVATKVPDIVANALPSGITTTAPASSSAIVMPPYIDLTAAFAGGLVGALTAVERHFDVTGVITLAVVGGLGGGILRDVLLQNRGIWAFSSSEPLLACLAAALVVAFFYELANKLRGTLLLVGALSMGLFAVAGTDKAILSGLDWVPVILLGTITAVGGRVVQAILLDEEPDVLKPGTLTATAAVAGAAAYVLLVEWLGIVKPVAMTACVVIVVGLRLLSIKLGWESPTPNDLTGRMIALPRMLLPWSKRNESDDTRK